jgi:hypothetical protein
MRTIPSLHGRAIGATAAAVALVAAALMPSVVAAKAPPFLTSLPTQTVIGSTVPGNGDINPYGIAVVPRTMGHLVSNDVLISNFNASSNLQGTGSTIVEVAPNGTLSVFATVMASDVPNCTGGVGLTTALVVLRSGWVIVGSLPTTDGTSATAKAGCLIVLNSWGHVVETLQGSMINGPWDMTAVDRGGHAILFVSNVLNGTVAAGGSVVNGGTVVRIDIATRSKMPKVTSEKVIGWGFPEKTDPAALVIGPTGLAFNSHGNLFVADTIDNRIAVISDADDRRSSSHLGKTVMVNNSLNQPLGLAMAPNGDVLAVNAGDGNAVELTTSGVQVAVRLLESAGGGTLFGLALSPHGHGLYFVDDGFNTLQLLH